MKRCIGLLLFFLACRGVAQKPMASFAAIDRYAQSVPSAPPDSLAAALTSPYRFELEKVRAIYSWICQHVQYNVAIYKPLVLRIPYKPEPVDTTSEWRSADEMVAQKVMRRGRAVCDGYSRLFKVLCQSAGIEAVVVSGYARTLYDRGPERFRTNHSWNAVRIDSSWQLLDVTWGAGYLNEGNEFVQRQTDDYFLIPPSEMVRDHFPEELRWCLLTDPPSVAEFRKMPFKSKAYVKYGIDGYWPENGRVEAQVGDTLQFSIRLRDLAKAKSIFPDPFLDTASFLLSPASVFLRPEQESKGKASYRFIVDDTTRWVHLLFNGDVILRYSVTRKNNLASK